MIASPSDDEARVRRSYRLLFAREPEAALRRTARRFRARFLAARAAAEADGHDPAGMDLETWLGYWKAAKRALAGTPEADPPG